MRVLGVDYGRRRIGLAISDATGLLARPWKTLTYDGGVAAAAALLGAHIAELQREPDGLAAVALGFPRRLSGEATAQTADVHELGERLRRSLRIPVVLQDERLSSHEAEQALARREQDWRKRKARLDAAAAAVILQDYLDGLGRHAPDANGRSRGREDQEA